jgi:Cys-rich repeat protein
LTDAECPAGWTCDESSHTCSCAADDQCSVDEACNDVGDCQPADVPGSECVSSTDCDPSLGCGAGYCLRCQGNGSECTDCVDDGGCGASFFCNMELASCVFCLTGADCDVDAGEICHPYGECGPPCGSDADCPHDRLCDELARCVPPPPGSNCAADTDCAAPEQCISGLCKACEPAADGSSCQPCQPGQGGCGDGYLCDYDVFVCVSCRSDADCSAGEVCQHGACTPE